jgi:hypothetical protein
VTPILVLAFALYVLTTCGVTGVLAVRLVLPVSPCRPVAAWWHHRIVFVMAPVPGWNPS